MRILLLDDDRAHGESLMDLLQSKGHEAMYAQCFEDATWFLELFRFDMAILDHDMPGTSGLRVRAMLEERFPGLDCLIISARQASEIPLDGLRFLPKPLPVPALLDMILAIEREKAGAALVIRSVFPMVKYR